jgi:hypothetical protein
MSFCGAVSHETRLKPLVRPRRPQGDVLLVNNFSRTALDIYETQQLATSNPARVSPRDPHHPIHSRDRAVPSHAAPIANRTEDRDRHRGNTHRVLSFLHDCRARLGARHPPSRPTRLAPDAVSRMCRSDCYWSRGFYSSVVIAESVSARIGDDHADLLSHDPSFRLASHRHGIVPGVELKPVTAIGGSRE